MYDTSRISLILPTYNEKDSIRAVIQEFEQLGLVDEIIVVNNNAAEGTSEEVAQTTAREISEPRQGYGHAIRRGLQEASGDLVVLCEPDDTFVAGDILKLLAYSGDVDIVYGSRTVRDFIWEGANMGRLLRWGNWATAKLFEVLYNTNSLSDVGCTFRLIKRPALEALQPHLRIGTSAFGLEMMILACQHRMSSIQIPLQYRSRVGTSSVTGALTKAVFLGLRMAILIVGMRVGLDPRNTKLIEWEGW